MPAARRKKSGARAGCPPDPKDRGSLMQRLQYTLHPLEWKIRLHVAIVGLNGIAIIDDFIGIEEQRIDAHVAVVLESDAG
jgi:hypothetical protein